MLIRLLLVLSLPAACVEPYYPPAGSGLGNQLVVNGFINATTSNATVSLSRAVALSEAVVSPPEKGATVTITGSNGDVIPLDEGKAGVYSASNLSIDLNSQYKLKIVTSSGVSYSSNDIDIENAPSLDSISWRPKEEGVDFFVSGHDPEGDTRFYRWTFTETWQYNVQRLSEYKKVDGWIPVMRDPSEFVFDCWQSVESQNILVTSTNHLQEDIVSMFPINFVKKGSRRFSRFYRIVVRQQAISQEEFEYWEMMKKTTENLGGLFDPLPTQVIGNLHNDNDPDEYVLGHFGGGTVVEKTLFIKFLELPGYLRVVDSWDFQCAPRGLFLDELHTIQFNEVYIKTFGAPGQVDGYLTDLDLCADCRSLGGDNKRPPDWPTK